MDSAHLLPDQHPQVGVLRFWDNALYFSSPQLIDDSFVVHMNRGGADNPSEADLDGALYLEISIHRSLHLVQWHRCIFMIFAAQMTAHTHSNCLELPQKRRAIGGDVFPEACDLDAPTSVLFRFPPSTSGFVF